MSRLVTWIVALAVIVAAGVVIALGPEDETSQAPFETVVALGQHGTGRDIAVTFDDVRAARVVEAESGEWTGETEGVWIAVDLTATSLLDQSAIHGWLVVDEFIFDGSTRAEENGLEGAVLSAGLPEAGTLLFEVPQELLETASGARILVAFGSDWRLDSAISLPVDLTTLDVEGSYVVAPPVRVPLT